MASEVDIVNSALHKIGARPIVSLTEGSNNANVASAQYPVIRDDLLRSHTWNFAIKRVELAQSARTPAFGFQFQYPVPSDYLRVVSAHQDDAGLGSVEYKIEHDDSDGTVLATDSSKLFLRYVARVTDPNRFAPDFREALAWALAREFSISISQSNTMHEAMDRGYSRAIRRARSADGQEDFPDAFPIGSWAAVRG